jgi:hypothetical protein
MSSLKASTKKEEEEQISLTDSEISDQETPIEDNSKKISKFNIEEYENKVQK